MEPHEQSAFSRVLAQPMFTAKEKPCVRLANTPQQVVTLDLFVIGRTESAHFPFRWHRERMIVYAHPLGIQIHIPVVKWPLARPLVQRNRIAPRLNKSAR